MTNEEKIGSAADVLDKTFIGMRAAADAPRLAEVEEARKPLAGIEERVEALRQGLEPHMARLSELQRALGRDWVTLGRKLKVDPGHATGFRAHLETALGALSWWGRVSAPTSPSSFLARAQTATDRYQVSELLHDVAAAERSVPNLAKTLGLIDEWMTFFAAASTEAGLDMEQTLTPPAVDTSATDPSTLHVRGPQPSARTSFDVLDRPQ
jgi:hypothetical protein